MSANGSSWSKRLVLFGMVAAIPFVMGIEKEIGITGFLGLAGLIYILTGGHYTLYLIWHTLPRDARGAFRYLRLLSLVYYYQKCNLTVPQVFKKTAKKFGKRTCLIFEDTRWSFEDLEQYSNRVANYFLREGFKPGDCVALFMENRPEYIGLWLGCAKIGVVPALINSHLKGVPLLHSIEAASALACIYGTELSQEAEVIDSQLPHVRLFNSGKMDNGFKPLTNAVHLDVEIINSSPEEVPESVTKCTNFKDKLLYIYTSGTTGLPKAAVIKHSRFYFYCAGMYYLNNMGNISDPVFYDPLPLYHSAGGIVGIGLMMTFGVTIVIRKKFSVRNFWKDCCKYECNGAQYIGEICRYLLSAPETPEEKLHKVEIMFGNGLRPQIWNQFCNRFGIHRIGEFYGATEGNSNVLNIDSMPGSVGFFSVLFPFVYPVRLIRVSETGEVIRDSNGICVLCQPGEPGEFVGKIIKNHPSRSFDGYVDAKATEKKIVKDVLKKGDMWFRSGDLLVSDAFGWMFFVDRLGDTYRWKGENVSTIEVEAVLSNVLNQQDAIVYGVEVPGVEGKAGMAAIVEPHEGIDLDKFIETVKKELPSYATPMFLRFVEELDITGTFKLKKLALQKEGFNPNVIKDPLYCYDSSKGTYRALDSPVYDDIMEMRFRI